ncbi:hypothetical protein EB093_02140 [bacterium]|nr:hypothetical protein [bacterium]
MLTVKSLSFGYRTLRQWIINKTYSEQLKHRRPIDLEEVVETGDRYIKSIQLYMSPLLFSYKIPSGIGVQLYDLYFPSPLTLAAFKDDLQIIGFWMNFGLGGATIKTVMEHPRDGNPRPRLQEVRIPEMTGLLNAMGLPGKGLKGTIDQLSKTSLFRFNRPIGISIGGNSAQEYIEVFRGFNTYFKQNPAPHYFEINISCPNTSEGQDILKNPSLLDHILKVMRSETHSMISVKLSPDQDNTQILLFAELVKGYDNMLINVGNTQYKTCDQVGLATNSIVIGGGGYSGEGLFPRTLEMVKLLANCGTPIMATGGISTIKHVEAVIDRGATLIGMATALVRDPYSIPIINHLLASQARRMV